MMFNFSETWTKLNTKLAGIFDAIVLLLPNLILSLVVAVLGFFTVRYLQRKIRKFLGEQLENKTMSVIMSKIFSFILMIALLFLILGILQLDQLLTSLLATAGVLGLAIGLALQEPLSNAFSGVMLSIKERFNAGDLIESNGHFGSIKEVNLRSTIMHVPSGQVVTIPNKMVLQNPIVNYSYLGRRRVELDCGISYDEDLDFVEQIVREALVDIEKLEDFDVDFLYTSFGDSSINFKVRFWIGQVAQGDFLLMKSRALRAIKKAFDKNDILIPFPIRTIDFAIKGGSSLSEQLNQGDISKVEHGKD